MAPSHLPSWGPTSGRKCYVTPAYSGIPKTKGDKIKNGYHTMRSQEPKKGRKRYVTLAFWGVPS